MEINSYILSLLEKHQVAFAALTCEKMLYAVLKFDEFESRSGAPIFESAITSLYSVALGIPSDVNEFIDLKQQVESFCPDLDETQNEFAPYALHSFISIIEAIDYIITKDPVHTINCATVATDTVDMYVQMASESEPPPMPELEAFIKANPFMVREMRRQTLLLEELAQNHSIDSSYITYLRNLNGQENIIDLDVLNQSPI